MRCRVPQGTVILCYGGTTMMHQFSTVAEDLNGQVFTNTLHRLLRLGRQVFLKTFLFSIN